MRPHGAPRWGVVLSLAIVLAMLPWSADAQATGSAGSFGAGALAWSEHEVPGATMVAEPTLGIPWNTDSLFFQHHATTMRARFDDTGNPTWDDVTPPYQAPFNFDPMLHADPVTGRIWAGGLHGACSIMMMSDDDGDTWVPAGNMCSGPLDADHQSIGSGPSPTLPAGPHAHAAYYCAQGFTISCATSPDGGSAWLPFRPVPGPCAGFHGHIRASLATGFVAVPVPDCGENHGFLASPDGVVFEPRVVPESHPWTNGFDPSLQFTMPSGWMYYGQATERGVNVALTKDEGATWETLGTGHGMPSVWLDVGLLHDPPVVSGVFASVQAGDDERAAVSFLGLEAGGGADVDFLRSPGIYRCDDRQDELVWRYYVAITYDGGATWDVSRISDDPVQVGGIWDVVSGGNGSCRNLLDFNDMDLDSQGRLHIAWSDGCVGECDLRPEMAAPGSRSVVGKVFRQEAGRGLFAAHDVPEPDTLPPPPSTSAAQEVPAPGIAGAALLGLAVVALAARRR